MNKQTVNGKTTYFGNITPKSWSNRLKCYLMRLVIGKSVVIANCKLVNVSLIINNKVGSPVLILNNKIVYRDYSKSLDFLDRENGTTLRPLKGR